MAGESPDRLKQRESSAEPTSGSTGPVPEARDPRVPASREKDSSGGGRVDTATKVLSVRGARAGAATESTEPASAASAAPEEDTELRTAVSSWVRGAKTPKPGPDTQDAPASRSAEAKADAGADAGADANAGTDAAGEPDAEAGAAAGAAAKAAPKRGAGARPASRARTGARTGAKARPGAKAPAGGRKDAPTGEAGDAGAADDVAAAGRPGTEPVTERAAGAAEGTSKAADGAQDATETADGGKGSPSKATATTTAATGKPTATSAEGTPTADTAKDEPKAGGPEGDPKTTAPEGDPEATPAKSRPEAAAPEDDPKATPAGAGSQGREGEGAGVDQATAVFKAVRPKKPEVDQPTTMLKLGGKPKPPESEAERTSKFVALRDDLRPGGKATPPTPPASPAAADATALVPQVGPERTTQQPLPPKPPLDLLAELTNTPPPPETPVRTLVRRVKIWTPLVLLLIVVLGVVQAFRPLPPPSLALTAKDAYTFDGGALRLPWPGEGQGWVDVDGVGTMGHFGKQTPVAIGSVAKTMTAYIVLRDHPLKRGQEGPKIEVDAKAEKEGGYDKDGESTLNTVKAGDHLTERQALSAVMIPSANNIARLLARWDAGSEAAFVKKMNATAKRLGMTGTTYTDPSGLKETTVSTAEDQVKLGRAVVKVPALVDITSAASWTDPSGRNWPNYNELPYRIGALGIKTGTTTAAGGNLLFASRKRVGGQAVTVVGAILDQQKPPILTTANEVSKTALLAAEKALTPSKILKKGDVVGYVDDGLGGRTPVVVTKDVSAVGWSGLKVGLSFTSGTVPHTAKAGTRVGSLTVGDGSAGGVKVPVALAKDLAEPGLGARLTRIG